MRRRLLPLTLTIVMAAAIVMPLLAAAQPPPRGPAHPRGGPTVVVRGYGGYPYYGPYWGMYPWYPYGYWGWSYWGYGQPYYPVGSVKLQVTPKQTQVFVDGYYVGIVDDFDGTFQSLNLRPGGHELVLYLEGYRTVRQSFYATVGKTFKVSYQMVPLGPGETAEPPPEPPAAAPDDERQPPPREPPPAAQTADPPQPRQPRPAPAEPAQRDARGFGTLSIRVQPADAEVLIDGERWRGPEAQERLLVSVAEGSHRVEIQKPGYLTYSTEVEVRSGEATTLNVSLPPRVPQEESR